MIQKPLVLLYEKILAIFQVKKVVNLKKKKNNNWGHLRLSERATS